MYYYLSKEYAKNNGIWQYFQSESPFKEYKEVYGEDCEEYVSENVPESPWWDEETQKIVEMPLSKAIERGIYSLDVGEYLDGEVIVQVPMPENCVVGVWHEDKHEWKDESNDEEKLEFYKEKIIRLTIELAPIQQAGFNDLSLEKQIEELNEKHRQVAYRVTHKDKVTE